MIPSKLELSNFLSYRQPVELDFTAIHLACISGLNGAGKSSILDAITWALFGQSRAKSDDDVVNRVAARKGEVAEVRFTFEQEGVIYRAIRRKAVNKSTMLDFQVGINQNEWKTLTASGVRQTQEAIKTTLNMNYDTFINASFLLQGKADEFTTKTPDKRKEILADLLGVNDWDRYKELASEQRKMDEGRLQMTEARQKDIDDELAEKPTRESKLVATRSDLALVSSHLVAKTELLEQARKIELAASNQRQMIANLTRNLNQLKQRLTQLIESHEHLQEQYITYQDLLGKSDEINDHYANYQAAKDIADEWQKKADRFNTLKTDMHPFELKIEREKATLLQRKTELEKLSRQIANLHQEKTNVDAELEASTTQLEGINSQLENLRQKQSELSDARGAYQKMLAQREIISKEADSLRQQHRQITSLKDESKHVLENRNKASEALKIVNNTILEQEEVLQKLTRAKADKNTYELELPAMKKAMAQMKERIENLRVHAGETCPLCGQSLSDEHRATVIDQLQIEGKSLGDKYRTYQNNIQTLEEEIKRLQNILQPKDSLEKEQRIQQERIARADARLDQIEISIAEWNDGKSARLEDLERSLTDDSSLLSAQNTVNQLEQFVNKGAEIEKEKAELQTKVSDLAARSKEIKRAIYEWEGTTQQAGKKAELEEIADRVTRNDFAKNERQAVKRLQLEINGLGYDYEEHQAAIIKRDDLQEAVEDFNALEKAKAAIKPLQESMEEIQKQIDDTENESRELSRQLQFAQDQLKSLLDDNVDIGTIEEEVNELREEQIEAHRQVAYAQQAIEVLDKLAQQREVILEEKERLAQRIRRLQLLEKACGRQGVQALLIERALPEIEDAANSILAKLSHGQMAVEFRTQRQLKSSDRLAETLDIHISDGVGERPYENYSGGEQFRVNFAIRLALSQILAKRAGARLQTLVIDEGFGSQDPDGRQRLIEAINTIQDDFKRIFVITHIDELRDAFPNRIEVEKSPQGSLARLI